MNFFKRAVISVARRPGKTMILLILVFLLGSVIAGTIFAHQAVNNTQRNLRRNLPPVLTIEMDMDGINAEFEQTGRLPDIEEVELTIDLIREIGNLPYVYEFDFSWMHMLISFELDMYKPENIEYGLTPSQAGFPEFFHIQGVEHEEMLFIEQGVIELVEGRTFNSEELNNADIERSVAIISSGFAQTNNISLNETFTLESWVVYKAFGSDMFAEENIFTRAFYEFEVVGIYDVIEQEEPTNVNVRNDLAEKHRKEMNQQLMSNRIYVPNHIVDASCRFQLEGEAAMIEENGSVDLPISGQTFEGVTQPEIVSFFILNDPLELDAFKAEVEPMLPEFIVIHDLLNTFESISTSMEILQQIAGWVLWGAVGVTLLVLSLLITLFLHDRRHEMGIYLALGEKKSKIVSQILLEVVVTALLGMTLAIFTGYRVSSVLSQNMLRDELAQQPHELTIPLNAQLGRAGLSDMAFSRHMTPEEMLEAFEVSLDGSTIAIYYGIGVGALVLSTLMPVIYVIKLNPKKVLL